MFSYRCASRYGDGTIRLTVEQDVIFPFIPNDKVEEMRKEPIFQKYLIDAGNLTRGLVSCTGAQVGTLQNPHQGSAAAECSFSTQCELSFV